MTTRVTRILSLLFALALIPLVSNRALRADDNFRAKATKVTVTEPMQVPGRVLAPGDYQFRLYDSDANRHIVEIYDKDGAKLITRILAIPNERLHATDKSLMTYAERPTGEPVALEAWFYSGETLGQQFVYPKAKAEQLSRLNGTEVPSAGSEEAYPGSSTDKTEKTEATSASTPALSQSSSATTTATRRSTPAANQSTSRTEPTYSASAQAPAPAQRATQQPAAQARNTASAPARQQDNSTSGSLADRSAQLPKTSSPIPLIALSGAMLIGVALLLKAMAHV